MLGVNRVIGGSATVSLEFLAFWEWCRAQAGGLWMLQVHHVSFRAHFICAPRGRGSTQLPKLCTFNYLVNEILTRCQFKK